MSESPLVKHNIHLGLGEAIRRLIRVEMMYTRGLSPGKELLEESGLIVEALNLEYQLDLGFDCNDDNVPDSIDIFAKSAETACCRIVEDKPKKVRGSSRESVVPSAAPAPAATTTSDSRKKFLSRLLGDDK